MKYITDSKLNTIQDRLTPTHYSKANKIKSKFERYTKETRCCGNVRVYFTTKTWKAKLSESGGSLHKDPNYSSDYEQISSAMLLYRSISLFETSPDSHKEQDFYKTNWSLTLRHRTSKQILQLGEWKGGFQIFTEKYNVKALNKTFIKDAEDLLSLLVSLKCPIGYDGVVAGTVA